MSGPLQTTLFFHTWQGYVKGNRKEPKDNGIQQVPVSRISSLFFRFPGFRFPGLTPVRKIGERDGAAVGTRDDRGGDEVDTLFSLVNQLHVRTSSIRRYGNRKDHGVLSVCLVVRPKFQDVIFFVFRLAKRLLKDSKSRESTKKATCVPGVLATMKILVIREAKKIQCSMRSQFSKRK